jgi:hypothetical protein
MLLPLLAAYCITHRFSPWQATPPSYRSPHAHYILVYAFAPVHHSRLAPRSGQVALLSAGPFQRRGTYRVRVVLYDGFQPMEAAPGVASHFAS